MSFKNMFMFGCRVNNEPIPFRPVLTVRPSSVTDNLRGGYHTFSGYDMYMTCTYTT